MSFKKKLAMGIGAAALGVSLLGGTYASYQDTEAMGDNDLVAGTMDLKPELEGRALFEVTDLAPGDWMDRTITFTNSGSVAMKAVYADFTEVLNDIATPAGLSTNAADTPRKLDDDIKVTIFNRDGNPISGLAGLTLKQLAALDKVEISGNGLAAGDSDTIRIVLTYDNVGNQNHQQGDSIQLGATFEGVQRDGVSRPNNDPTPGTPQPGNDTVED